ncbi:MAG TPA: hypothetical protein VKA60_27305 [Blastocatellia bacterium]|nr:hypothetical protein [Blastocatellia bacterium]
MEERLLREIRFLKAYAFVLTVLFGVIIISGFTQASQKPRFDTLEVQRINVVEKDGTVKMVLSNKERAPDALINGKSYPRQGGNSPGIVFYNDKGDECGGLVFSGDAGGKPNAGAALLFDQYHQDQTVGIMYNDSNGRRFAGLNVWDRPETPLWDMVENWEKIKAMKEGPEKTEAIKKLQESGAFGAQRVFVGKGRDKAAAVILSDGKGKARIKMSVDEAGVARLEFLDENGKVAYSLPEGPKK